MKIGIVFSSFDLLHAGHVLMLKEAREVCDYLIAGLQTDPTIDRPSKNKPIQSVYERMVQLQGCRYVDEVLVYDTEKSLIDVLESRKIDVRIVGEEYRDKDFTGKDLNIPIFYNSRNHKFSSTELRKRLEQK